MNYIHIAINGYSGIGCFYLKLKSKYIDFKLIFLQYLGIGESSARNNSLNYLIESWSELNLTL